MMREEEMENYEEYEELTHFATCYPESKSTRFKDSFEKISAEEVFAHNDKLYFGYYNKKSEVYNIVEFEN